VARRLRVVLCGPYPLDEQDLREADGLLHSVINLAQALTRAHGVDVHIVSRSTKVREDTYLTSMGIPVTYVPDPTPPVDYLFGRRLLTRRLLGALRGAAPDIVHAHGEAPFIFAALRHTAPHVITLQSLFKDQTRPPGGKPPMSYRVAYHCMRSWERKYIPRIKNLLAVNEVIATYVKDQAPSVRIFRTINTAAESFFSVESRETVPVILSVSQISQRKGLHHLIAAFARLSSRVPDCQLRIVGAETQDPGYAAGLRRQHEQLIRDGRLVFLGGLLHDEVREELSRCAIFCLASLYEASPLTVAEAMAAAKPVVVTRVGDLDELVGATRAGFVVEPGDVTGLAAALQALLSSPDERAAMGKRGRETARKRSHPDVAARDALAAYNQILGRSVEATAPAP